MYLDLEFRLQQHLLTVDCFFLQYNNIDWNIKCIDCDFECVECFQLFGIIHSNNFTERHH